MEPIEEYRISLERKGLTKETIDNALWQVRRFEKYLADQGSTTLNASPEQLRIYWKNAANSRGRYTAYMKTASVFFYYLWLVESGVLLINTAPKPIPQRGGALPRTIPDEETIQKVLRELYNADSLRQQRNALMIDMAYSGGFRLGELQRMNLNDIDPERGTVRVKGKGGDERVVPIGRNCLAHLIDYIQEVRPRFAMKCETPALFVTDRRTGRISVKGIKTLFSQLKEKHSTIRAHALRHAFATDLLRNGATLQDISQMLGHAHVQTTQIYTRLTIMDLQKQHKQFHPRG